LLHEVKYEVMSGGFAMKMPSRVRVSIKDNLPIAFALVLASFAYIWNLWNEGLGNLYYAAGVYSMGQNFHTFFYNSLDSVGFVSIDKPPLGLWIQVLFTKVFGFNGMALLLPQALAGVLSVYLIYRIINKRFGRLAGTVAAIVLALTPIVAAISRNNTMDGLLILTLILASDQLIKSIENKSFKYLIFAGILIGLGFNIKMLQSFMIVPAVYLTYLVFSDRKILIRLFHCFISVVILLTVSLSWIIAVDLTPAADRPFVGSSGTNSALTLALGYNGINRLFGNIGGDGGKNNTTSQLNNQPAPPGSYDNMQGDNLPAPPDDNANIPGDNRPIPPGGMDSNRNGPPGQNGQGNSGGPRAEGGATSFFRLYNSEISGQASWFLIPAILASIYALFMLKKSTRKDTRNITLFYFTMCFIPMFIYYSFSGGLVHRYYLAMFAFPVAALTGIAISVLVQKSKEQKKFSRFILPFAFVVTAIPQLYIQSLYSNWLPWLFWTCGAIFAACLLIMIFGGIVFWFLKKPETVALFMAVLFILPGVWTFSPAIYGNNAQLPIAGPELANSGNAFSKRTDLTDLVAFLEANRGVALYLASVPSSMGVGNELILQSDGDVMVLGGFNGGDNPVTLDEYKIMISDGVVKYAIVNQNTGNNLPGGGNRPPADSSYQFPPSNQNNYNSTTDQNNGNADSNQNNNNADANIGQMSNIGNNNSAITKWIVENCSEVSQKPSGVTIYDLNARK
jgi:4-amino-4-deoxy-L-arabinose transferase-like glycosyltransferase